MPPDNETPAQTMARVSRVLRSDARPTLGGGYQADIGVGSGPFSGGVFAAGAPVSGQPQVAGANVGVGPLSAQFVQPMFKGAQPSYGVGFNADEYFGANVMKTPGGMQYGVRAGPVSVGYNPTRKDLSIMGGFERRFADGGPVLTSKRIASSFVPPEEQGAISPSMEGVMEGAAAVGRGIGPALQATGEYITSTRPGQVLSDVGTLAGGMYEAAKQNPAEFIGGAMPLIGNMYALRDIAELKDKIAMARAAGDEETALKLEKFAPLAAVGAAAPFGAGAAVGAVTKAAERAAVKGVARELSPIGLYSQGAEAASMLPQAKGTPEQMSAMLQKYGVKPAELEGFNEAFVGKPSVTREEIAAHFKERMPQIEETVLGGRKPVLNEVEQEKWIDAQAAERARDTGDIENVRDWANASPEIRDWHREEAIKNFNERMVNDFGFAEQFNDYVGTPTKFSQYTLPGGENYREVLLKLNSNPPPISEKKYYELSDKAGLEALSDAEKEQMKAYTAWKNNDARVNAPQFRSSHWDDPDVLAHIRMADRTGPNGEKILHVEEIQSDWAQKGRKEGFAPSQEIYDASLKKASDARDAMIEYYNNLPERHKPNGNEIHSDIGRMADGRPPIYINAEGAAKPLIDEFISSYANLNKLDKGIPSAPYVTNTQGWTDLALKRVLKEAAEGGYDKVVWTPGAEQAKRYDLSKQISKVGYDPNEQVLFAYDKNGREVILERGVEPQEIEKYIGKEPAEKLRREVDNSTSALNEYEISKDPETGEWGLYLYGEQAYGYGGEPLVFSSKSEARDHLRSMVDEEIARNPPTISGLDLEVGGEGMKGYYDKIVPTQLAKLTKKLDPEAKIERDSIQTQDTPRSLAYFLKWAEARGDTRPRPALAVLWANGADEPFVQQFMKETSGLEVPSLTITPKMREAIMQGLPSYAEGGEVEASESEESKQAEIKECLLDLRTVAKERKVYRPKLAYLIRQMGGADHSRSQILANNLINDDLDDLVQRLENQPRAVSMIKKLTEKID